MAKINHYQRRLLAKMICPTPIYLNRKKGRKLNPNVINENIEMEEDVVTKAFNERYKKESAIHLEEIDFIISNLLERTDFKMETDYESFTLRKEDNKGYIYLRISKNYINIDCNDSKNNESLGINDSTLYTKWYDKLEDKYFEFFNRSTKNALNIICDITNLSRKSKISKLMKENDNEK